MKNIQLKNKNTGPFSNKNEVT